MALWTSKRNFFLWLNSKGGFEIGYTEKVTILGVKAEMETIWIAHQAVQKNSQREREYMVAYFILSVEQNNNKNPGGVDGNDAMNAGVNLAWCHEDNMGQWINNSGTM